MDKILRFAQYDIQVAMIVPGSKTQTCLQVLQRPQPIFAYKLQKYTFFLK